MKKWHYKNFKKGMGIITKIPGDEHDGKQNIRPGIVLKTKPKYVKVQLLSSQTNKYDFFAFTVNNKKQYIRSIYLKNIPLNQIIDYWKETNKNQIVQLDPNGKIIKTIEKNPLKLQQLLFL